MVCVRIAGLEIADRCLGARGRLDNVVLRPFVEGARIGDVKVTEQESSQVTVTDAKEMWFCGWRSVWPCLPMM